MSLPTLTGPNFLRECRRSPGSSQQVDLNTDSANWHADITFEPVPSDYAILKIHTLPSFKGQATGGDTLWASSVLMRVCSYGFLRVDRGYEVYDRLSPSFAKYLETLEAVHEARFFHQVAAALGNKLRDGES